MTRMNVSFKESLVEDLRRLVPLRRRSEFISAAVQGKLEHLKQEQAVRAAAGTWSSEGRGDPGDEIRTLRGAWDHRLPELDEEDG